MSVAFELGSPPASLKRGGKVLAKIPNVVLSINDGLPIGTPLGKRLTHIFKEAAIEAIACKNLNMQDSLDVPAHDIETNHAERKTAIGKFQEEKTRLRKIFDSANFILVNDNTPDKINGGSILEVSVDTDKLFLDTEDKAIVQEAIRATIAWMGYGPYDSFTDDQGRRDFLTAKTGPIQARVFGYNR